MFLEILFVIGVGAIVSLDVAALTAVRQETYFGSNAQRLRWAVRNGFWHSFLLLIYGLVAVAAFDWMIPAGLQKVIDYLAQVSAPHWLTSIAREVQGHFAVVFAVATIALVWGVYRRKIVENPLVDDGDLDWQRRLARGVMTRLRFPARFIRAQLQSMAVAMDMLALAFLLKSLNLFKESAATVVLTSIVIFVTVSLVTLWTAQSFRRQFRSLLSGSVTEGQKESVRQVLIIIRLSEPLLIFFFISELMSFVVWGKMSNSSFFFISSALLVLTLVRSVGFKAISDVVDEMISALLKVGETHAK